MDRVETNHERLEIEHLHNDTLSLQRSGYLWKTGPNYKSFKNRWCVLYRHSQNYFDANLSYYFNRSSMSASLSGKILLAEKENVLQFCMYTIYIVHCSFLSFEKIHTFVLHSFWMLVENDL